jgi:predicted alpha/beta-hydrolase family hydrolase
VNGQADRLPFSEYALHAAVCAAVAGAWVAFEVARFLFNYAAGRREARSTGAMPVRGSVSRCKV